MKGFCIAILLLVFTNSWLYGQEGAQIYKTYCAGCHGTRLEGNSATKLIKTQWTYGRGRGALIRSVKFEVTHTEMIAWQSVLEDDEINAVVDFIIAAQKTPPDAIRPIPNQITTKDYMLKVEKLVEEGISTPWSIGFVDANHALITERSGNIRRIIEGKLVPQPIQGFV